MEKSSAERGIETWHIATGITVAEKCWHNRRCGNQEEDGTNEHHNGLGKALLAHLKLDIDNSGIVNGQKGGNSIKKGNDIADTGQQRRSHLRKPLRTIGIIWSTIADISKKTAY